MPIAPAFARLCRVHVQTCLSLTNVCADKQQAQTGRAKGEHPKHASLQSSSRCWHVLLPAHHLN